MFVDASAIVAILTRESEADNLADTLEKDRTPTTSPIAIFEATLGVCRKLQECRVSRVEPSLWADGTKRLLRAEMTRRGVTYEELAERLAGIGVQDTAVNLRNKVAHGRFSAAFLVQCLSAMGARTLRIEENQDAQ
jgi:uncharacterized protein with PIN domain